MKNQRGQKKNYPSPDVVWSISYTLVKKFHLIL